MRKGLYFLFILSCFCVTLSLLTLCFEAFQSQVFKAQENQAPQDTEEKLQAPEWYDQADILPPKESFEYWLDTVATDDQEFLEVLHKANPLGLGFDVEALSAKELQARLRLEREKRLEASYDFEKYFEVYNEGKRVKDQLTPHQQAQRKEDLIHYYLGPEVRRTYAKRNIRAIRVPTSAENPNPNWDQEEAFIYLDMLDLIYEKEMRLKVLMKLDPVGLMWRWYQSFPVELEEDEEMSTESQEEEAIQKIQGKIKQTKEALAQLEAQLEKLEELKAKRAQLELLQNQYERELRELQRKSNPYKTPELAFETAYAALKDGDWEVFLQSHTQRVRMQAGVPAKSRFEETVSERKIRTQDIREVIYNEEDPNEATLKVNLQIAYRKEIQASEHLEEGDEPKLVDDLERRVIKIRMLFEDGKWLIDEDL